MYRIRFLPWMRIAPSHQLAKITKIYAFIIWFTHLWTQMSRLYHEIRFASTCCPFSKLYELLYEAFKCSSWTKGECMYTTAEAIVEGPYEESM
jgi:hypothetical protein